MLTIVQVRIVFMFQLAARKMHLTIFLLQASQYQSRLVTIEPNCEAKTFSAVMAAHILCRDLYMMALLQNCPTYNKRKDKTGFSEL